MGLEDGPEPMDTEESGADREARVEKEEVREEEEERDTDKEFRTPWSKMYGLKRKEEHTHADGTTWWEERIESRHLRAERRRGDSTPEEIQQQFMARYKENAEEAGDGELGVPTAGDMLLFAKSEMISAEAAMGKFQKAFRQKEEAFADFECFILYFFEKSADKQVFIIPSSRIVSFLIEQTVSQWFQLVSISVNKCLLECQSVRWLVSTVTMPSVQ